MIRHISVFTVNTQHKEENISALVKMLLIVQKTCSFACGGMVMRSVENNIEPPNVEDDPIFGDVIQILDFLDKDSAAQYPSCAAHLELLKKSLPIVDQAATIDFELPDV